MAKERIPKRDFNLKSERNTCCTKRNSNRNLTHIWTVESNRNIALELLTGILWWNLIIRYTHYLSLSSPVKYISKIQLISWKKPDNNHKNLGKIEREKFYINRSTSWSNHLKYVNIYIYIFLPSINFSKTLKNNIS